MKSLKPHNVAVENDTKRSLKEADTQDAQRFQPAALLPNTPQRILSANVLKLQRMIGNKAVQRLLTPRMTNKPMLQREPKKIMGTDDHVKAGKNSDGKVSLTFNDSEVRNGEITVIAVVDVTGERIDIDKPPTSVVRKGDSVIITVDLNGTKLNKEAKRNTSVIVFKTGSGTSGENEQKGDDNSNSNASEAFPPAKTETDFTDENGIYDEVAYRAYLIEEILKRAKIKEENKTWKTLPLNFKVQRLKQLNTSNLVDLLTITTERKNYKAAQCFVSSPDDKETCLKENPD